MSVWSVWEPGGGSMVDVSGLANVFSTVSSGLGRAETPVGEAVGFAGELSSDAVSAWLTQAAGVDDGLGKGRDAVHRLALVFDAYATAVGGIARQAEGLRDKLGWSAKGMVESVLSFRTALTGWQCNEVVSQAQEVLDPDGSGFGQSSVVHEVVYGLANLARQRTAADEAFDEGIRQTMDAAGTLFGVAPTLPESPFPANPPTLPPGCQVPGPVAGRVGDDGWWGIFGSLLNEGFGLGKIPLQDFENANVSNPLDYRGALGMASLLGDGLSFAGNLAAFSAWSQTGRDACGNYPPGYTAEGVAVIAQGASTLVKTAKDIVSASRVGATVVEAAKTAASPAGKLVPGLGIATSALAATADVADIVAARQQHDTGATVGASVALFGDLVSGIGSGLELGGPLAPAGFALNLVGDGISAVGSLISHFWRRK